MAGPYDKINDALTGKTKAEAEKLKVEAKDGLKGKAATGKRDDPAFKEAVERARKAQLEALKVKPKG